MGARNVVGPLLSAWQRLAREQVDTLAFDRAGTLPPSLIEGMAALGMFGLTLPERYGGAGFGLRDVWPVIRSIAAVDASLATSIGLHLGLGTRPLVRFGTPAQHERWLPDLATGRRIASFAATEPSAGSDLRAVKTTARSLPGRLVVQGQKSYVTNGGRAGLFTVYAATPDDGGRRAHGLVLVEPGDRGVVVGPEERKLGLRASSTTPLFLDDVEIPTDRLLGPPGEGAAQLAYALSWGRTMLAAGCVGMADGVLAAARRHCAERRQFRGFLDQLPIVRERLADMEATRFGMEAIVDRATDPSLDDEALASVSIAAKVACSEGAWATADMALQLHGGLGCMEDSGLPLRLRDARATRIFEGANDVLLLHAGTGVAFQLPPRERTEDTAAAVALAGMREAWLAAHGGRLTTHPRMLRRLGALWVEREVGDAVDARAHALGTPASAAAAAIWHAGSARRVAGLEHAPVDASLLDTLLAGP